MNHHVRNHESNKKGNTLLAEQFENIIVNSYKHNFFQPMVSKTCEKLYFK
jgi:hypothetical protein